MPVHYAQPPKQQTELPKEEMDKVYAQQTKLKLPTMTTLNKSEKEYFIVDFAKVSKIEELVLIIASMGVVLSTDNPLYPQLQHLVDKENPIKESDLKQ
jgi:hypothetical protein